MIEHQKYDPSKLELQTELLFMYMKYEQVCKAYKRLAEKTEGLDATKTVSDMSQMEFQDKGEM
jgi:hypothetical protein